MEVLITSGHLSADMKALSDPLNLRDLDLGAPSDLRNFSAPWSAQSTDSMVYVPAGSFLMGSGEESLALSTWYPDEKPAHQENFTGFYLDKTEVTVSAYGDCVASGSCTKPGTGAPCNWGQPERVDHPVNCVDWNQARSFCAWAGKRLPTEAEWEYAARTPASNKYPWGNAPPNNQLCWGRSTEQGTCAVASYSAGGLGIFDLAGNVWEWTSSSYRGCYSPSCTPDEARKVIRGSSWSDTMPRVVRAAFRRWQLADTRSPFVGLRCAKGPAMESMIDPMGIRAPKTTLSPADERRIMVAAEEKFAQCGRIGSGVFLTITVSVSASGAVNDANISGPLGQSAIGECISQQIRKLHFPPFADTKPKKFVWSYAP